MKKFNNTITQLRNYAIIFALLLLVTSCSKKCRCYRYDGDVDEFTDEELEKIDYSCSGMEQFDLGQVYSICEKPVF